MEAFSFLKKQNKRSTKKVKEIEIEESEVEEMPEDAKTDMRNIGILLEMIKGKSK